MIELERIGGENMLNYTGLVKDCSDEQLTHFVEEIFTRNLTAGQWQKDSGILQFLADQEEISLGAFEKVCLAEFIWRNLTLDKTHLILPENWTPGSEATDYTTDPQKLMSVRERN